MTCLILTIPLRVKSVISIPSSVMYEQRRRLCAGPNYSHNKAQQPASVIIYCRLVSTSTLRTGRQPHGGTQGWPATAIVITRTSNAIRPTLASRHVPAVRSVVPRGLIPIARRRWSLIGRSAPTGVVVPSTGRCTCGRRLQTSRITQSLQPGCRLGHVSVSISIISIRSRR